MKSASIHIVILLVLACSTGHTQAQLSFRTGRGTFDMAGMKDYQTTLGTGYPVSPEVISQFPSFWVYDAAVDFLFDDHSVFGVNVSRGSTGGRLYYSDYSGTIGSDQLLSYWAIGMNLGVSKNFLNGKFIISGSMRPSLTVTKMSTIDYMALGNESSETTRKYTSLNTMLQPTVDVTYRLGHLGLNMYAGYNLSFRKGALKTSLSSQPLNSNGGDVHADWMGVRVGGGVSYFISGPKPRKDQFFEKTTIGVGMGLDHGGVGFQAAIYPIKEVGVFVGAGYAIAGMGLNTGLKLRAYDEGKAVNFYCQAMYGYNAGVYIIGNGSHNKFFFGPSFGGGLDWRPWGIGREYFSFGLVVPVRSDRKSVV